MLHGYTMAIVPCGNPTPKKLPTGGGEWPTFRTARAQRAHSARYAPYIRLGLSTQLSGHDIRRYCMWCSPTHRPFFVAIHVVKSTPPQIVVEQSNSLY